jgi:hypothetical protein
MTHHQFLWLTEIHLKQRRILAMELTQEDQILCILYEDTGGNVHRQGMTLGGRLRTYQS